MPFPMDLTTLPEPAGKVPPGSRIPHSDVFSTLPAVPVQRDESGDQFYSDEIAGAGRHSSITTGTMYKPDSAVTWKKI